MDDSESALREFEAEILDTYHQQFELWHAERASAIVSVVSQFDIGGIPELLGTPKLAANPIGVSQSSHAREEGLNQALRWLTEEGAHIALTPELEPQKIRDALAFTRHAADYVNIADFHRMLGREQIAVKVNRDLKRVVFYYPENMNSRNSVLGVHESTQSQLHQAMSVVRTVAHPGILIDTTLKKANPTIVSGRIVLEKPDVCSESPIQELVQNMEYSHWDFIDPEISFATFTAASFQKFWRGFRTWAFLLNWAYIREFQKNPGICTGFTLTPTQVSTRDEFVSALTSICNLPQNEVDSIVTWLTFDRRPKTPDFHQQPILFDGQLCCWSPSLILRTAYMRNALKLMSRIPQLKDAAATIIGGRERPMLRRLGEWFSKRGRGQIRLVAWPSGEGDADFAYYNNNAPSELLLVQAKAVLDVDEINEVHQVTESLKYGQEQLKLAISSLVEMPLTKKAQIFKGVNWKAVERVYGVVITPNSEPHHGFDHVEIPAISMATISSKFRDPHFKSPRAFWSRCKERPWYKPITFGVRRFMTVKIGSVTYEMPNFQSDDAS